MDATWTVENHVPQEEQPLKSTLYKWSYKDQMFSGGNGRSRGSPALTVHNGKLWCLWVDKNDGRLYYATGDNNTWSTKTPFVGNYWTGLVPDNPNVGPALADFNGTLHAAYSVNGDLVQYQYDETTKRWGKRSLFARSSAAPSLQAFDGRLFCAFQGDGNRLMYTTWDPVDGWMKPMSTNEATWGSPALYLLDDKLCLLFSENDNDRRTMNTVFDSSAKSWSRNPIAAPSQKTAYGVSATGFDHNTALMAFQSNDSKGLVLVDTYNSGSWQHEEAIGATSTDTPAIAILNDIITVAYNARNGNADLLWSQATLLNYTSENWMTALASTKANLRITDMSIPGTHDSCSSSLVPWVSTQNMTVLAQLNAGIRYLDLRCRLVNATLMMYHGPYSLDMTFGNVMNDIYTWLRSHSGEGLIVQLSNEYTDDPEYTLFAETAATVIHLNDNLWNIGVSIPMFADILGKIQLIRRYNADKAEYQIGIDATAWADHHNSPRFTIPVKDKNLVIQDRFEDYSGLPKEIVPEKFSFVTELLDEASADGSYSNLYINYTSMTAARPFRTGPVAPWQLGVGYWDARDEYTPGINVYLRRKLVNGPTQAHYGVIVIDFPELPQGDLINYIISSNFQ
ncbi:PLC-like phosphodiesterase [Lentinula aciculospora]|uniref:PLC-like phosphodiesterase n=1 Tax=Lentinula aciculospora TaxID=153920 RepID=A0A9W9A4V7_9AGAR|nr:PLC-like phosphodiesterase [Lentinula aciculospora]